jgi:hypothetical protein
MGHFLLGELMVVANLVLGIPPQEVLLFKLGIVAGYRLVVETFIRLPSAVMGGFSHGVLIPVVN